MIFNAQKRFKAQKVSITGRNGYNLVKIRTDFPTCLTVDTADKKNSKILLIVTLFFLALIEIVQYYIALKCVCATTDVFDNNICRE